MVNEQQPELTPSRYASTATFTLYPWRSRRLMVHALRDDLGLTGTHIGCDTSQCGACAIDIDGDAVKSCTVPR